MKYTDERYHDRFDPVKSKHLLIRNMTWLFCFLHQAAEIDAKEWELLLNEAIHVKTWPLHLAMHEQRCSEPVSE